MIATIARTQTLRSGQAISLASTGGAHVAAACGNPNKCGWRAANTYTNLLVI